MSRTDPFKICQSLILTVSPILIAFSFSILAEPSYVALIYAGFWVFWTQYENAKFWKAGRYLSKGNYNISRIGYLGRLFPDARFVIPVRDPVDHVASLMKQHRLFCEEEARNPKVLAYMQRAGHFEFGLDLRPINFGNLDTVLRIQSLWSGIDQVRGWAAYWSSAYSFIADLFEKDKSLAERMLIVDYSDFCKAPAEMLRRIYSHCELEVEEPVFKEQGVRVSAPTYYKPAFSKAEIGMIEEETGRSVERIRRLTGYPAAL